MCGWLLRPGRPPTERDDLKRKKIFSAIGTVLTVLIVTLTVYVIVSLVIANVRGRDVNLFGYSFGLVLTPSMEPEICMNDLIIFNHADISEVEEGDIVVFVAGDGFDEGIRGRNVVHRVVEVLEGSDGSISLVTRGVANTQNDREPVTAENFSGVCVFHSSAWGAFFIFMRQYGVIILIAVVAVPFIVSQVLKIVRLSREAAKERGNEESDDNNK